jgi:hypothetical protein
LSTKAPRGLDRAAESDLTAILRRTGETAMSKEKGRPGREKKKPKADKKAAPANTGFLPQGGAGKPGSGNKPSAK